MSRIVARPHPVLLGVGVCGLVTLLAGCSVRIDPPDWMQGESSALTTASTDKIETERNDRARPTGARPRQLVEDRPRQQSRPRAETRRVARANPETRRDRSVVRGRLEPASATIDDHDGDRLHPTLLVAKGDTLYAISKRHRTSVDKLKELNGLRGNEIKVGDRLILPMGVRPVPLPLEARLRAERRTARAPASNTRARPRPTATPERIRTPTRSEPAKAPEPRSHNPWWY